MRTGPILRVKLPGFTLNDVLVALAIVGILVLLALPQYSSMVTKAKATEAKLQLRHLHTLQKNHFYTHSEYAKSLDELGFEQKKLKTEGGEANYRIEIVEGGVKGFTARAKAVVDFDQDGQHNIWEVDQDKDLQEVQPD